MKGDPFRTSIFLLLMLLIGGCDSRGSNEKLLEHVSNMNFEVDVVVLEMRGVILSDEWFPVVLYFGYGNDGNMRWCLDEANRLNKKENEVKYRCGVVAKSVS